MKIGALEVDQLLHDFVVDEALPGTGVTADFRQERTRASMLAPARTRSGGGHEPRNMQLAPDAEIEFTGCVLRGPREVRVRLNG